MAVAFLLALVQSLYSLQRFSIPSQILASTSGGESFKHRSYCQVEILYISIGFISIVVIGIPRGPLKYEFLVLEQLRSVCEPYFFGFIPLWYVPS